jgi:hypothetical protein
MILKALLRDLKSSNALEKPKKRAELLKERRDPFSRKLQRVATGAKTCDLLLAFRPKMR